LSGIVCSNGTEGKIGIRLRRLTADGCKYAEISQYAEISRFFETFLRPVEFRGISRKIREMSHFSLMNSATYSLRHSKVQFCQFFGMNGAVFLSLAGVPVA
jgi:hypothetical protein